MKTFTALHSYVIQSPLCIPNTSWKHVSLLAEQPGVMSERCWKCPMSKNEDRKAVRHFEENNHQWDDLHANRNKIE